MVTIWGKVYINEKIVMSETVSVNEKEVTFFDMLRMMCEKLGIPTPVLLRKHVSDFNLFNMCIFKPDDFIDSVNFSRFSLNNISSDSD